MKKVLTLIAAPLLGMANAEPADRGYSYEVITVKLPADVVSNEPVAPFRSLSDLAWQRGAHEATSGTGLSQAYQGGSPLGRGELRVVYSITPQRGVFYVLPDGPYGTSNNFTGRLPSSARACKMVIKWSALTGGPIVSRMDRLAFPDADCKVPVVDPYFVTPQIPQSTHYVSGRAQIFGKVTVSLLKQIDGIGLFDPARPFDAWLRAQNDRLVMMIPLNGLAGQDIVYARSKKGRSFVLFEDRTRMDRACVAEGLNWPAITERDGYKGISVTQRICMDLADADDRSQPPLDPRPDITTMEIR